MPEFVAELGLCGRNVFDLEWRLSGGEGALIAARTGVLEVALQAMTFQEVTPDARIMVARKNRRHCSSCPAYVHRKAASLGCFSAQFIAQIFMMLAVPPYLTSWGLRISRRCSYMPKLGLLFWIFGPEEKGMGLWGRSKCCSF